MGRHVVATVDELPNGGSKRVEIAGRDIALFRIDDSFFAIQDRCPHQGASLCAGRVSGLPMADAPGEVRMERRGELVRCPWHAWEFDIRTGESFCDPDRTRVRSYLTNVQSGADLLKGPYVAETYPVTVANDYVLIETDAPGWIDVAVQERRDLGGSVSAFVLARTDGQALPRFEPGAHVDVEIAPGLTRQYSLCSDPGDLARYRIAVAKEPASRGGSSRIHKAWQAGTRLRMAPPRNHFRMSRRTAPVILIGGGIGITPLIPMAQALARSHAQFELHYLARSAAEAPFLAELQQGEAAQQLHVHLSQGDSPRRMDIAAVLSARPDADIYVCGPGRLIDAVSDTHRALGFDPVRLHVEHFTSEVSRTGAPFEIEIARTGKVLEVAEDKSIAEVLIEHGVPVSLSCEQGVCGTCFVPVLAGEPDHRDRLQSDAEKRSNWRVATCCSRARSSRLVLDV